MSTESFIVTITTSSKTPPLPPGHCSEGCHVFTVILVTAALEQLNHIGRHQPIAPFWHFGCV
jgi:hypothetical protein